MGPKMTDEGLQINEDPAYQARFWRAQRVAWGAFTFLLILALLGLTGGAGWFSQRSVGDDVFSVSYPSVLRQQTAGSFVVTVVDPAQETILHFDTAFHDTFTITAMSPPATEGFATSWGVAYRFALSGNGPVTVQINVAADQPAQSEYTIVADGHMAMLSTLILP